MFEWLGYQVNLDKQAIKAAHIFEYPSGTCFLPGSERKKNPLVGLRPTGVVPSTLVFVCGSYDFFLSMSCTLPRVIAAAIKRVHECDFSHRVNVERELPPSLSRVLASNTNTRHDLPIRRTFPKSQPPPRASPEVRERIRELAKENVKLRDPYVLSSHMRPTEQTLPKISGTLRLDGVDADSDDIPNACLLELYGFPPGEVFLLNLSESPAQYGISHPKHQIGGKLIYDNLIQGYGSCFCLI